MNLFELVNFFLLISCSIETTSETSIEDQWRDFKIKYNKTYESQEEATKRFEIFKANCNFFRDHNENKTMTFRVGENKIADLTYDEISKRLVPEQK